jgi:hypothetical protein
MRRGLFLGENVVFEKLTICFFFFSKINRVGSWVSIFDFSGSARTAYFFFQK